MKVVINAFSARRGGGQTYLINLLKHLDEIDGLEILILAPPSLPLPDDFRIKLLQTRWPMENPLLRTAWERFALPGMLRELRADVLFCPGGIVATTAPPGCKTVTMFRNMIPFDRAVRAMYPPGYMRVRNWLLERAMLSSMLTADLVIFISDFARSVIETRAGSPLKTAVTIPHGINEYFRIAGQTAPPRPDWLPKDSYFLYVSIFDFYKHQMEVVQGYHLLKQRRETPEKLVLAGHNSSDYGRQVREEIIKLGLENDIILPGNIPYIDLPAVYYHAKLNIFASVCENCPNILLEAMGAGRPLLVSCRQPMPEFCGDAAIYFEPSSPEDFAGKIMSMVDKPSLLADLSTKTITRSTRYDWRVAATNTWSAIMNINSQR